MRRFALKMLICAAVAGAALPVMSQQGKSVAFDALKRGWDQKTVAVPSGGAKPSVEKLVSAFCKAWPTRSCADIQLYLNDPMRFKALYSQNNESVYAVTVDRGNGFLMASDEGGDSPYFFATLWRRSNGHTLLGIHAVQPVDPNVDVLLFYDYNPKTAQLVPERAVADYLTSQKYGQAEMRWVELPREGKDVVVTAYGKEPAVYYTFRFNGLGFDEPVISSME